MREVESLNDRQREAVAHGDGPLLVLAGAGSGKTRVIVHRIAHLIRAQKRYPDAIVAVTFTNKAAAEMSSRVQRLLPELGSSRPWISTFHSLCARVLRSEAPLLGLPTGFTIFDDEDQRRMLGKVAKDLGLPNERSEVACYQAFVERARNAGQLPSEVQEDCCGFHEERLALVYDHYHRQMRANGTLDFGDLILAFVELLRTREDVRLRYRRLWTHLLVDEFQDTNPVQYQLVRLLTSPEYNLTVVGDDDQSIYAWRGATVGNLLSFAKRLSNCRVVRLEQNYRSTQAILDLANAVIIPNTDRLSKTLWTANDTGEPPVLFSAPNELGEAQYIASRIKERWQRGQPLGELAVFYRTNAQSRTIEEHLRRAGIPYRVIAGTSFYQRQEIKDVLAYLRLAVNSRDHVAAVRIVNTPRRSLGDKTLERILVLAKTEGITFSEALVRLASSSGVRLRRDARDAMQKLAELLVTLQAMALSEPPSKLTEWLLEEIDFQAHLVRTQPESYSERFDNVLELLNAIRDYEEAGRTEEPSGEQLSLLGFLESSALVQGADGESVQDAVNLMTIHASKGLEFPVVFLSGLEDGLLPLVRSDLEDDESFEEERRLCYVAITRAKRHLTMSHAFSRRRHGEVVVRSPSRFLSDIPPELIRLERGMVTPSRWMDLEGRSPVEPPARHSRRAAQADGLRGFDQSVSPCLDEIEIPPDGLRLTRPTRDDSDLVELIGQRARHKTFGQGRIVDAEYSGQRIKLTIDFPAVGQKKVIRNFVEVC